MGWDAANIDSTKVSERKMSGMIGEGLHLGCIGLTTMLVYNLQKAPWWPAGVVPFVLGPVVNETVDTAASTKRRRIGLLRQPSLS
jgi:hypothetical protein